MISASMKVHQVGRDTSLHILIHDNDTLIHIANTHIHRHSTYHTLQITASASTVYTPILLSYAPSHNTKYAADPATMPEARSSEKAMTMRVMKPGNAWRGTVQSRCLA